MKEILLDEEINNEEKLIKLSEFTKVEIKKKENSWEINRRDNSV